MIGLSTKDAATMGDRHIVRKIAPDFPTSDEFTKTLGQISWLMTLSKKHRTQSISKIETDICTPLMFKQVRVYTKGQQPLSAVIWAYASLKVKRKIAKGDYVMGLQDWRSGPEVVIVDCISPFIDPQISIDEFMTQVEKLQKN